MTETIQMRTTDEESGDYRVFDAATVGGEQPVKGLALHHDITGRLDEAEYVELTFDNSGAVELAVESATSATIKLATDSGPAVRHVYVSPEFFGNFGDVSFDGKDTDLDALPSLAIDGVAPSSEEEYEAEKEERANSEERTDADEAADALFGETDDSDESEDSDSDEQQVEVSDEEIGIVEN
jgi:hypothetical protein